MRAFYKAIRSISVLDPACGSGAFLFAALNIQERLYDTCLVRMQAFVDDLDRSEEKHSPEKFKDFRETLAEMNDKSRHPSPRYFILKSIILNNLYGVDIMEEATEICKLRLFLKLVAQVNADEKIEPLPDIDFNIRAGNSLVGFTTEAELRRVLGGRLDFDNAVESVKERAELAELAFARFRDMQVSYAQNAEIFLGAKLDVQTRLAALRDELDAYLSGDFGIQSSDKRKFAEWRQSHQPFHWFVEFFRILADGGFDAVIGNPPYIVYPSNKVQYRVLESHFETINAKNLYACVFEQSLRLAKKTASVGLIVQLTALSSERTEPVQTMLHDRGMFYAISFPRRPRSVFAEVEMPVVILISTSASAEQRYVTTGVNRFYSEERNHVTETLRLAQHSILQNRHRVAKVGSPLEVDLFEKIAAQPFLLGTLTCSDSKWSMYYQEACRYWVKAIAGTPFFRRNRKQIEPPHGRIISFSESAAAHFATCVLNSSLFYWLYSAMCDCEHINDSFVRQFPIPTHWTSADWCELSAKLMRSLEENATRKVISTSQGHKIEYDEMNAVHSKGVIDEIDVALADLFGLTPTELEFTRNYSLKYRVGNERENQADAATGTAN